MVDHWPSRVAAPTAVHHDDPQAVAGVAALSPQFDLAVSPARRSVPPIGSLSPQRSLLHSFSSPQKHAHRPFAHNPFSQLTPPPPPAVPAADLLAEATHSAELHSAAVTLLDDPSKPPTPDFDLFGLAKLDLGPSVKPAVPSPSNLITPFHSTAFDLPFAASPLAASYPYPAAPQSAPPPSTSPRRDAAHPTRCVQLRNIPPGIDDDDIRRLLTNFGPLRDLGAQQRSRGGHGSVLATYYDLRHARAAVRALHSAVHFGRCLDARFQCPIDIRSPTGLGANALGAAPCANHGTLVVFNLDSSTSAEDIRSLFSAIGDVKEIRATPNKKHHKFVEFYDVRDAQRAMHLLNKTEVGGKRIKIEISRPGGRAASMSRPTAHQSSKPHANATNVAGANVANANAAAAFNHQPRNPFGSVSHSHLDFDSCRPSPTPHIVDTSSPLSHTSPIRTSSPYAHQFALPSPDGSYDVQHFDRSNTLSPRMSAMLTPSGFDATNALTGSLDSSFAPSRSVDGIDAHMMSALDAIPDPRSVDLQPIFSQQHAQGARAAAKTISPPASQKPLRDTYMQALYHSPPGVEESRGGVMSPAAESAATRHQLGAIGVANGAQRSSASDIDALSAFNQPTYADTITSNNGLRTNTSNTGGARKIGNGAGVERTSNGSHRHSNGSKSHANGHGRTYANHHQVNSKYVLDIAKVRSGEETRTALMIRNIPNKYNQKMLLSTLESEHKGHFDFIYLPIDFKNKCNVGYAFINFTKPEFIEPFYNAFHGKKWGRFNSEKVCEITFARIQGRQQLIAHFQNSSLLLEDPKCRPVIFDSSGRQEEFPIGSHVRTRRGPSSRDSAHRSCDGAPPFSPTKHRARS